MQKLANKIAVITGGSSGIGLATAKKFVQEGAYVFITGRRQLELDKAIAEIGSNVTAVQGDISNLSDLDKLFSLVKLEKGTLDILVSSAGIAQGATTAEATPEHFDATFNVNTRGTFFAVQKALPILNNGGSIVIVSSSYHLKGFAGYAAYSASKAAVRSFVRTWAAELKEKNIRANTISPGGIDTPLIDSNFATKEEADAVKGYMASVIPLGRLGAPEEMAKTILFLASDDSSYVTGFDLVADGGATQL